MKLYPDMPGLRLDIWLSEQELGLSRSAAQKLIENGYVRVNGQTIKKNYKTGNQDEVEVVIPEPEEILLEPEDIPLDIRYEDADVIVINKPKGLVVHPAVGHPNGTLVNALLYHCRESLSGINGELRPGIVHRIDMETSGLLIVAKNDTAHIALSEQLKDHSLSREYEAVVVGTLRNDMGTIDAPIGRHHADRKKMAVTEKNSRRAVTHYAVISRYPGYSHVRVQLETGRTHQIRVHFSHIHHPVVGDCVYGRGPELGLTSQCLHARALQFRHPTTGEMIRIESELPTYFTEVLKRLEKRTG